MFSPTLYDFNSRNRYDLFPNVFLGQEPFIIGFLIRDFWSTCITLVFYSEMSDTESDVRVGNPMWKSQVYRIRLTANGPQEQLAVVKAV